MDFQQIVKAHLLALHRVRAKLYHSQMHGGEVVPPDDLSTHGKKTLTVNKED